MVKKKKKVLMVKKKTTTTTLPDNAGDVRDASSIPGSERSLGKGNGNPLQYFCLKNSTDRGAW